MADSIYTFDPTASNNTTLDGIPYGPNQLYHNKIDDWFRSVGAKLAQFVDDLGGVNTVAGTGDAVTVTLASGITAYATGQLFSFKAGAANTGAATINVNGIGAKAIRKISGGTDVALSAGDIAQASRYSVVYDSTANSAAGAWILAGAAVGAASTTTAGVVELATNAEVDAGSSTTLVPTVNGAASLKHRRDRIVNGGMRVSQENGTTSGTANGYYAADQWATYRVTSAGTITSAQVASVTPAGSPNRYRVTITAADASLAAGEYLTITQNLEGSNVADLQYGGASAKNIILRFGFKGPAGTYAARLGNSAANRSYVTLFTISAGQANTDTVQTISIAGDATGTWLTADGVIGLTLDIVLACGSTFQGTTGWQAGLIYGTSGVSNGMGTISSVFELFDVGLKLDPDATGVYGAYDVGEVDAVYRIERYWWAGNQTNTAYTTGGPDQIVWTGSTGGVGYDINSSITWPFEMAKLPTVTRTDMGSSAFPGTAQNSIPTRKGYSEVRRSTSVANGYFVTSIKANARLS